MRAATEESAIAQALMIVGAGRDEVSVEVIERSDKGVTVRLSPHSHDEPAPPEPEPVAAQVSDLLASEADDEAPELVPLPLEETELLEPSSDEPESRHFAADDAPSLEQVMEDEAAVEPVLFEMEGTTSEEAVEEPASTSDGSSHASTVPEDVRERARAVAQAMLDKMGLEAQATLASRPFSMIEAGDPDAESRVYVSIGGAEVSILIGKHGATLQSFQYLLNLSLNNRGETSGTSGSDAVRVVVDAGGYRSRRAEVLERSAQEAANRAKREGRAIRMDSMPAHERRLVHMALRDDSSITTGSEGREPQRFVVIAPSDRAYDAPRASNERSLGNAGQGEGGRGGGYNNRRGRR